MIDVRGARCRVRRATQSSGVASVTQRAWTDAPGSPVKLLLEEITAEKAQRIWGMESVATVRATMKHDTDLRKLDGLMVLTGKYAGNFYLVVEDPKGSELGTQLVLLGLQSSKDRFGL